VVLDGPQEASLASLPFASKLDVVTRSPALPAGLVVTIDSRVSSKVWSGIEAALAGLGSDHAAATALGGIQMERFSPVDDKVLVAARKAYASAP
jgi:hypothetical protein